MRNSVHSVHVCSFQAAPDVTSRTSYEELRAAVLKAGRFSAFEASANQRAGRLYTRLCQDPTIETTDLGFPWTGVKERPRSERVQVSHAP
jgi:hypothetical protein